MGLLDSVLGAAIGSMTGGNNNQQGGGLAGVLGSLASNPQVLNTVIGMLGNDSAQGGLGGLVNKFNQAGLGDVIGSWIGSGQNQNISADQLSNVLGSDALAGLAQQMGLGKGEAAGTLANVLPDLINHLTPNGQAPQNGFGNAGDLMGMLGGLLNQKG